MPRLLDVVRLCCATLLAVIDGCTAVPAPDAAELDGSGERDAAGHGLDAPLASTSDVIALRDAEADVHEAPISVDSGAASRDSAPSDGDGDGIADSLDNCPRVANERQSDRDGDDVGDLCDVCPALRGDGGIPLVTTSFVDMGACAGFTPIHVARGLDVRIVGQAFGDYDRDGWLDLYVTTADGPNGLYRNRGDGSFELSGLADTVALAEVSSGGATFADYDNDGWLDLHVVNVGPDTLFHNEAGLGFSDVTARAGVGGIGTGMTSSWGDYDEDGYLDLYVANYDPYDRASSEDRLYHNEGDGTFRDATAVLDPGCITGFGFVATFTDIDEDGDLDIYLANDKGNPGSTDPERTNRNVLFRNDGRGCGDWCFAEVAIPWGADLRMDGMGIASFDLDSDGDIDHLITNTYPPVFLRNEFPDARFADVTTELGLGPDRVPMWVPTWGTVAFDYDRDSLVDLYVGGWGPDYLFGGTARGVFVDRSAFSGLSNDRNTTGAAWGDYDRDGRVDLVVGNFAWDYQLFRNLTPMDGRHGITVRLVGGGPVDRDGIGSRVWLEVAGRRTGGVCEVVNGASLGGGSDLACHFGVGDQVIDAAVVRWLDGTTQRAEHPAWDVETVIRHSL